MRVSILQPGYLPWLGFFEQIYRSDIFVIYDDVQYDKNSWRNRNKIKTPTGSQWLTMPVSFKFTEHTPINKVKINNSIDWGRKHLFSIKNNYSKAPYYKTYIEIFEEAYSKKWEYLLDIDMYFINKIIECLDMKEKKIILSSNLNVKGDRLCRLINICKILNADTFYEGHAGKDYIDDKKFIENGIMIEYQNYKHPAYNQLYGDFISYLSIIDLIFNCGQESLSILANDKAAKGVKKI